MKSKRVYREKGRAAVALCASSLFAICALAVASDASVAGSLVVAALLGTIAALWLFLAALRLPGMRPYSLFGIPREVEFPLLVELARDTGVPYRE